MRALKAMVAQAAAVAATSAVLLLWAPDARAQANYESEQLGGRTSMMGGAAVATGEDQATAFINPAGITRIPGQSFSFSTFAVSVKHRTMPQSLDATERLGLEDSNVSKVRLRIVPNTFCLFLDGPPKDSHSGRSRHKYAMCAASTEREEFDFTKARSHTNFSGAFAEATSHATDMSFVRSTLALAWGLALDRDTSIGVTARTDNARLLDHTAATTFSSEGDTGRLQTLTRSTNAWSWDTSLVIGLTSKLSRHVTLGASLTTPSQHLVGRYTGIATVSATGDAPHTMTQDKGDFRYNHPGSVRLGLGFTWPRFVVELNGSFYGPQKQLARANFDRAVTVVDGSGEVLEAGGSSDAVDRASIVERGRPVTNLAFGAEYFFEPNFSLVSGFQTDFSGIHPRQMSRPTDTLFRQEKDSYHAAVGVTSYGERGRLLLGVRGHYSRGTILIADAALADPSFVSLKQVEWGASFVLSGRISFRAVREAAARATNPLTQQPKTAKDKRKDPRDAEEEAE